VRSLPWLVIAAIMVITSILPAFAAPLRERSAMNSGWRFQRDDPPGTGEALSYANLKSRILLAGGEFTHRADPAPRSDTAGSPDIVNAYAGREFDDSHWRQLDLPHDWGIEGPFRQEYPGDTGKLPWWGVAWYRKRFTVPAADKGRRYCIDIDGAMSYATVWLNGKLVGGWPYGYASFEVDLTSYLDYGADNVVAIRLDNPPNSSRWYPGGGIYRNVWLVKTGPVHIAHWGVTVTTPEVSRSAATINITTAVTNDAATINITTAVTNDAATAANVTVKTELYALGRDGRMAGQPAAVCAPLTVSVPAGARQECKATTRIDNPTLWELRRPERYMAVTTVEQQGKPVDRTETPFGVRTIRFDAARGFLLNGEPVRIQGVCDHHDLGALGAALNVRALERQIELLQEMGANAIRTSHNPPAPELLDLCDRMGMLVMDESFDCWRRGKRPNDYHLLFDDWHENDLRAEVRRDRNHPCIILWSIGNEIPEQYSAAGRQIATELARIVHEEDPTRPVTAACDQPQSGTNGFQLTLDVFGYNYKPQLYATFREKNPTIPLYGSETASTLSSRGEYFFPFTTDRNGDMADFQVGSYDLTVPPWATTPDAEFRGEDQSPFVAGEFVWTGFDYLGEPTPYNSDARRLLTFTDPAVQARMAAELKDQGRISVPSRSSYFGIIDLAGFKKDRFYLYQARWRPELRMAHLMPHWNWPERSGQITPVQVYTSGDEAELFLNGRSLGRKKRGQYEYRLRWDEVKYEPGELKVVAYKGGKRWAEDVVRTTGPAARLLLAADRARLKADGCDLAFITVTIADQNRRPVPRTKNRVHFDISGPGEIAAVDNGDAASHEPFQAHDHSAYNGLCLVIIRTKAGAPGRITLKAQSDGLTAAEISVVSAPSSQSRQP
jgi:beta-galactosidase